MWGKRDTHGIYETVLEEKERRGNGLEGEGDGAPMHVYSLEDPKTVDLANYFPWKQMRSAAFEYEASTSEHDGCTLLSKPTRALPAIQDATNPDCCGVLLCQALTEDGWRPAIKDFKRLAVGLG